MTRRSVGPLAWQLVRQVANKTNDVAGDGTTTSTVLCRAIFAEGCKAVAAGMNPMDLRRGINLAVDTVLADLKVAEAPPAPLVSRAAPPRVTSGHTLLEGTRC